MEKKKHGYILDLSGERREGVKDLHSNKQDCSHVEIRISIHD